MTIFSLFFLKKTAPPLGLNYTKLAFVFKTKKAQ